MARARLSNVKCLFFKKIKHLYFIFSDEKDATVCMYLVFPMQRQFKQWK